MTTQSFSSIMQQAVASRLRAASTCHLLTTAVLCLAAMRMCDRAQALCTSLCLCYLCSAQGLPLTKAREVGVSVMKQAQELAADSQGQVQFSAAGSSTPQPQCVLLAAGQGAAGSEQQQAGAAVAAAASGAAAAAGRQTRVAFSAKQQPTGQQLSASSRVISPPALFPAPDCGDDADMGADISSQQQRR
jgi:hypothetical protein